MIGLGVSGKASARFLLSAHYQVTGVDRNFEKLSSQPEILELIHQGMDLDSDAISWKGFDFVVLSPGILLSHPLVVAATKRGVEVIGEVELALRHLKNRAFAITGTNGKTTTVLLITHFLQRAGKKARALGNIGASLTDYLLHPDPEEILVVELSSFQLETAQSKVFDAALILNITPNHLNWHPTMQEYAKAKARIQLCLKPTGELFVSKQVADEFGYLLERYTLFDQEKVAPKFDVGYIKRGLAESMNVQAAFAFCKRFGLEWEWCERELDSFRKPPHRIEWVKEMRGVCFFNDSKASNIHAVMHAVSLFEAPLILLAGGVHKGASYTPWISAFQGKVKQIIAFGQASRQMEAELSSAFPILRVENLEDAVLSAYAKAQRGETILLSPGCSSYDQFQSYEHRGDEFKRIVRELK